MRHHREPTEGVQAGGVVVVMQIQNTGEPTEGVQAGITFRSSSTADTQQEKRHLNNSKL